ncbi:hypothetical protein TNCV_1528861 [Trichonephila clavipes]|nr:hypothetical protein TNCV_1528861 [Trichonephila clavipes]
MKACHSLATLSGNYGVVHEKLCMAFYRHGPVNLDTLRENCGIIRKQASTDGGVLWKVMCVDVVQVR